MAKESNGEMYQRHIKDKAGVNLRVGGNTYPPPYLNALEDYDLTLSSSPLIHDMLKLSK